MNLNYDADFHAPAEKTSGHPAAPPARVSSSPLAVVSLFFGILSYPLLPILGAIIAIVTGHFAIAQIRESEGRYVGKSLAKAGMTLGYAQFVLAALIGGFFALYVVRSNPAGHFAMVTPAASSSDSRGVKMLNEMSRADFQLITTHSLAKPDEDIIACYTATQDEDNPELALLTTRHLAYLKEGRITSFPLDEISTVVSDPPRYVPEDDDHTTPYVIDVQRSTGARMRIKVFPYSQGKSFSDAIDSVRKMSKAAGEQTTNRATTKASE